MLFPFFPLPALELKIEHLLSSHSMAQSSLGDGSAKNHIPPPSFPRMYCPHQGLSLYGSPPLSMGPLLLCSTSPMVSSPQRIPLLLTRSPLSIAAALRHQPDHGRPCSMLCCPLWQCSHWLLSPGQQPCPCLKRTSLSTLHMSLQQRARPFSILPLACCRRSLSSSSSALPLL